MASFATFLLPFAFFLPMAIHCVHFAVQEKGTGKYCLILEANITGTLEYPNMTNSTSTVEFAVGASSLDLEVSQCGQNLETLQFSFLPTMKSADSVSRLLGLVLDDFQHEWIIQMEFAKNNDAETQQQHNFVLQNYSLTVHYKPNMNASEQNETIAHIYYKQEGFKPDWSGTKPKGFCDLICSIVGCRCTEGDVGFSCSQNELPLNLANSSLHFNKLKVLAFVSQNETEFKQGQVFDECTLDTSMGPLIVGLVLLAALLLLVVVLLLVVCIRVRRACAKRRAALAEDDNLQQVDPSPLYDPHSVFYEEL